MNKFEDIQVRIGTSILEALRLFNEKVSSIQALLIVDENNRLIGTLTDGDIRRGLIAGSQLSDDVSTVMQNDFRYIVDDEKDVMCIRQLRKEKILFVPIVDYNMQILDVLNLQQQRSLLPIDAILMAGGKGERLRPLTLTTPKPLLPVGDKVIIDHNIDRLISYGVKNISVTINYLAEQIEEHFREPHQDVQIQCVHEPKFLGTMGAVQFISKFYNDVILVMNSDLFTDIDFEDMYLHFMENEADMSVAAIPYTVSIPFGICDLDGRKVTGIVEKPTYNYYANAGIYMIRREMLDLIPEDQFFNATDMIEKLVELNHNVIRYPLTGTWIDIGNKDDYQKAQDLVKHLSLQ